MHVIEPARYQPRPKKRRRWPFIAVPLVLVLIAGAVNYLRPLPTPIATVHVTLPATETVQLAWPDGGQAAVAAEGYGLLDTYGGTAPLATASIAKVITALCVLQKQPLTPGQTGPTYTIGAADVAFYNTYAAEDGSLVPVVRGEQLTEYQALQALMIPSANNIADSLSRWVFGSHEAYAAYAQNFLRQHGLNQTHIGLDAGGFDASTTSTASDLAMLGLLALKNPVLMQIASQPQVTLPVAGTVSNYDTILGVNGITGLKTGNSDADPGAFLFTATAPVGGRTVLLTGAVMGAPDLETALQDSAALVASLQKGFEAVPIAHDRQVVGRLKAAWGATVPIVPAGDLNLVRWRATPLSQTYRVNTALRSGEVGSLHVSAGRVAGSVPLRLAHPLAGPSFWWRLTRH
ncbi:MAG TPA: hypothetical protein VLE99_02090 [Candidatus Saccharimonadales bacterium]|nr:hypothetical protein [Candidatus Saccharimonadales bacterium]